MAKKFKLQTVLNYRQSLEDQAQQQLAASLQRKNALEAELQLRCAALQQHDRELKERQQDGLTVAEITTSIGADSLGYVSLDGLVAATDIAKGDLCRACFDGKYPVVIPAGPRENLQPTLDESEDDQ